MAILMQVHGYRSGHQLLSSSIDLAKKDQELIDRLSDITGSLRPNENFSPYLTTYPLPSRKYYALAITEQDLSAPRAGCVSTATLLVPMDEWISSRAVSSFFSKLITPLTKQDFDGVACSGESPTSGSYQGAPLGELVEALFLEKRIPTVLFDVKSPFLIAERVLSSLWPSLRSEFSVCTFALAPRQLGGRSFDLQFAVKSSRSNFSDWKGRRIDNGSSQAPRHKWTNSLVAKIFHSKDPSFLSDDSLGALSTDSSGSENALRLTLLWNELYERAKKSPTAVLGMIDIANSQGAFDRVRPILESFIISAVDLASNEKGPSSTWEIILSMVPKLDLATLSPEFMNEFKLLVNELALVDVKGALRALLVLESNTSAINFFMPMVVANIEQLDLESDLVFVINVTPEFLAIPVFTQNQKFSRRLFAMRNPDCVPVLVRKLAAEIVRLDEVAKRKLWTSLLPICQAKLHFKIISNLLAGMRLVDMSAAVKILWSRKDMRTVSISRLLIDSAVSNNYQAQLAHEFLRISTDSKTLACVAELLANDPCAIDFAMDADLSVDDFAELVSIIILKSMPREKLSISDHYISSIVLALGSNVEKYSDALLTIFHQFPSAWANFYKTGIDVLSVVAKPERLGFAKEMLDWVRVADLSMPEDSIRRILQLSITHLKLKDVVSSVMACDVNVVTVNRNIVALMRSGREGRELVALEILEYRYLILERSGFQFSNEGLTEFLAALDLVKKSDHSLYVASCVSLAEFSLLSCNDSVVPLLVESFPVLYHELKEDSSFLKLRNIFFSDWDKCKMACMELVRTFVRSKLSPLGLARIAYRIDEIDRVCGMVLKSDGGSNYANLMLKELESAFDAESVRMKRYFIRNFQRSSEDDPKI